MKTFPHVRRRENITDRQQCVQFRKVLNHSTLLRGEGGGEGVGGGGGLAKLCFVWTHLIGGGRAPPNSPSPRQVPRISGLTLVRGKKMNKKKQKVLGWFLPRPWIPSLGNHDMYEYVSF